MSGLRYLNRNLLPHFRKLIQKRVFALPKNAWNELFRRGRIALTLILSGIFAWAAHESTARQSLDQWLASHAPSELTLSKVLWTYGLRPVTDGLKLAKGLRHLPSTWDSPGTLWWDPNSRSAAWMPVQDSTSPGSFLLYSSDQKSQSTAWERLGVGWPALESLINRLHTSPLSTLPQTPPKRSVFRDPREIAY